MNRIVKWKNEEQYQNPKHTVVEKCKECEDIHRVVEWKRDEGEMKDASLRAFLLW